MKDQYDLIHNGDWDTLLILDALRYDIFKKLNKLEGTLVKAQSRASHTYQWLKKTWPDVYDLTYISGHPYIGTKRFSTKTYNACDHFREIIPVWKTGWNDELGTVHPGELCRHMEENDYDGRCVVHFMQPHGPWIGTPRFTMSWTLEQHETIGYMGDVLAAVRKPDKKFLTKAYKGNVRLVLKWIEKYKDSFKGKTVITADHGEMLGEKGVYLHFDDNPEWARQFVREIPWFTWSK